jgi:hypothetical protein
MTTIRRIITRAHRLINNIGVSEELSADEMDVSLQSLDAVIQNWSNNKLNIYTYTNLMFPLTASKGTYTLGPEFDEAGQPTGADWVITRPMRVEKANLVMYKVPVEPLPNEFLTTELYPVDDTAEVNINLDLRSGYVFGQQGESTHLGFTIQSGSLVQTYFPRDFTQPPEEATITGLSLLSGTLIDAYFPEDYTHPPESATISPISILSGTLVQTYFPLDYTQPPESATVAFSILSGTLV